MTEPQSPYSQIELDERWAIVAVDAAFECTTGIPADDALGEHFDGLVSRRDRRGVGELDRQRATYDGGRIDVILQMSGREGDALVRLRASKSARGWRGWLESLLAHSNDILQRLSAETEWCRNVVSRSDEGIVVLDPDNRVSEINQSAMDLLAFRSAEGVLLSQEVVMGADFFTLLPGEVFRVFSSAAHRAANKKKLRVVEDVEHEDKALEVRLTAMHLPVRGHVGCTLSIRDITVQREIERVSSQLRIKNEDIRVILSNLDLGILTIEAGGRVHPEYSDRLPCLLGTKKIAGRDVIELLFGLSDVGADDRARVRTALDLALGDSTFGFELNRNCFPTSFSTQLGGRRREFEADWAPIESEDGIVHRILVVLRDVTELNRLRTEALAQQRELTMIGELLATPQDAFDEYASACHGGLVQTLAHARGGDVDEVGLARTVHTLKGNARAWGLKSMCDALHDMEEELLGTERSNTELATRAVAARKVLEDYQALARAKLNRGPQSGGTSSPEQDLLREVFEMVSERPEELPPQLRGLATSATFLPLQPRLETIASKLLVHAEREGKGQPRFSFPSAMLVHRQRLDQLHGAFVHLLTNAVDHGLESVEARVEAGKDPRGTIRLDVEQVGRDLVLTLQDDGVGLALGRLRAKSGGRELTPEAAERLVFDPGVSTAERVTQSSGRGMGMAAVRADLIELGGSISLDFHAFDGEAEFAPFRFRIVLPHTTARLSTDTVATRAA